LHIAQQLKTDFDAVFQDWADDKSAGDVTMLPSMG
jgi:hypothetical protein